MAPIRIATGARVNTGFHAITRMPQRGGVVADAGFNLGRWASVSQGEGNAPGLDGGGACPPCALRFPGCPGPQGRMETRTPPAPAPSSRHCDWVWNASYSLNFILADIRARCRVMIWKTTAAAFGPTKVM